MANSSANCKFKIKETQKKDIESSKSKYFKPGFIFNNNEAEQKKSDNDLNNDLSDEDYDEIISQASQKISQSTTANADQETAEALMKPEALARIDQVESQSVDFTCKSNSNSQIPSLKGNNTILVNSNQQKNPLLQSLRSTRYVITDSIAPAHYLLSDFCCALYLSLKYHVVHSEYIYERINELKSKYKLKILLVMVDHPIYETHLKELSILAIRTNFTLMLAWSYDEAAKHIENYRINADKSPDVIMGRFEDSTKPTSTNQQQSLVDALTSVKSVNRTDAITLMSTFETLENIVKANTDELTICPGISMVKARRLHSLFNKPFIKSNPNI